MAGLAQEKEEEEVLIGVSDNWLSYAWDEEEEENVSP